LRLTFVLVGRGEERAAAVTGAVVNGLHPQIVASLGIAGALSDNIELGDVLVADQIVSYFANAKASSNQESGFHLDLAGDAMRSDEYLVHRAVQLPMIARDPLAAVQARLRRHVTSEVAARIGQPRFAIVSGPLASGTVVGASRAFATWLRSYKRDYLAIDMESSGAAVAAATAQMIDNVRFIAMRGISDRADEDKSALERSTRGGVRRLAVLSSLEFFLVLLASLPPETFT